MFKQNKVLRKIMFTSITISMQRRLEKLKRGGGGRILRKMASFCGILNKMSQGEGAKDRRPPPVRLWQHENSSLQRTHGIIPSMLEKVRTIIVSISFKIFVKVNSQLLRWGTYEWIKEERKSLINHAFLKIAIFRPRKKLANFWGALLILADFVL